ncbi:flagellar export protein FliJ [Tissierella sp. MB52-C2]|uniref:flagellar export protein FliJ n=1 Tax=Tissierella sp. MB52-C2 TaxID=3070999 RepID=UPI00280C2C7F|nr:flagellar export protein FliJ [Tissierella sp. MB52-C2]WMM26977.1 flagellar export protein FliJ [Tissierella sp. MB52-C2]
MNYSFKLEKVLNYKENIEDLKKSKYGDINSRVNNEEERLIGFNQHKENLVVEKNKSVKSTSIGNLKLYNSYLQDISVTIQNQERKIEEMKVELEEAKEELLVAMQEKKAFEKLKENDYKEFIIESKRQEEKLLDGIVTFNTSQQ